MDKRRSDLILLGVALALLVAVSLLRAAAPRAHPSYPSTYDSGANGYSALYEFLQREDIDAARYELPLADLPKRATLVVAGDYALDPSVLSTKRTSVLDTWVRHGGRLIVLGSVFPTARNVLGLAPVRSFASKDVWTSCGYRGPRLHVGGDFAMVLSTKCGAGRAVLLASRGGTVAAAFKRGRGEIVEVVTPTVFDNLRLAERDNAAFAYDLFSAGAAPLFDERVYGYAAGKTFWQVLPWPVRAAILIAGLALALAIVGANLRLAPARQLESEDERDSSAYIASLAGMLQRGGVARDIIARIAKAASGLRPPAANDEPGRKALSELNGLRERYDAGPREVLRAGTIFAQLRKDYEW
jgi:hypothetical protein